MIRYNTNETNTEVASNEKEKEKEEEKGGIIRVDFPSVFQRKEVNPFQTL